MKNWVRQMIGSEYTRNLLALVAGACLGYGYCAGRVDRQARQKAIEWETTRGRALKTLAELRGAISNINRAAPPVVLDSQEDQADSPWQNPQHAPPLQPDVPEPSLTPLPLPMNGEAVWYVSGESVGPLEIKAAHGRHYFVRVADSMNGSPVLDVFIRSGESVNIEIPLGQYVIKYASGNTWYGSEQDKLFGPETVCSKADRVFAFSFSGDQVQGYSITLYAVPNGNMSTSRIPRDNF